jgi:geranylgeranyl transferase type-2 subunit alpha
LIGLQAGNFSAWHFRSQLLNDTDLKKEIAMAKSAFWTEPREQSSWIYYRWLIGQAAIAADTEFIQKELADIAELIEVVPAIKYPFLATICLQRKLPNPDEAAIAAMKARLAELDPIQFPYSEEQ